MINDDLWQEVRAALDAGMKMEGNAFADACVRVNAFGRDAADRVAGLVAVSLLALRIKSEPPEYDEIAALVEPIYQRLQRWTTFPDVLIAGSMYILLGRIEDVHDLMADIPWNLITTVHLAIAATLLEDYPPERVEAELDDVHQWLEEN